MTSGVPQDARFQQIVSKPIYHGADLGLCTFPYENNPVPSVTICPDLTVTKRALTNPSTHWVVPSQMAFGMQTPARGM